MCAAPRTSRFGEKASSVRCFAMLFSPPIYQIPSQNARACHSPSPSPGAGPGQLVRLRSTGKPAVLLQGSGSQGRNAL